MARREMANGGTRRQTVSIVGWRQTVPMAGDRWSRRRRTWPRAWPPRSPITATTRDLALLSVCFSS